MKKLKGRLRPGKVAIRVKDAVTKTTGGIIIPGKAQKKFTEGTVMSIGSWIEGISFKGLAVGDNVHYRDFAGVKLNVDDCEYLVMSQEEILLVSDES